MDKIRRKDLQGGKDGVFYTILSALEEKYGDLSDDGGCYVNGKWLSVNEIVELILQINDDYDFMLD
jgi:hypothetical protein